MQPSAIDKVTIVGVGWSGRQIAAQLLAHGISVALYDTKPEVLTSAIEWIGNHIDELAASGYWSTESAQDWKNRLSVSSELGSPLSDLVLECTFEQVSVKRRVLQRISDAFPPPCIIASNSSYFVPSILARYVKSPERFVHWHFHVPVWISKIVDIVPCENTVETVLESVAQLSRRIDQIPIIQRNESPGYIFNALLRGLIVSALQLADRKIASPTEIDLVWKSITKMEIGPFGIMDEIGLDIVEQSLSNARWDDKAVDINRLIEILEPFVHQNKLGKKTGEGFFSYGDSPQDKIDG